jgi:Protein of unknown function (DUF3105)
MAHRKADKQALRRERERREAEARAAQERKRLVGYGAAGVLAIAAIALVVLLAAGGGDGAEGQGGGDVFPEGGEVAEQTEFDLETAARGAGCELNSTPARGERDRQHVPTDQTVNYQDNPPTLGAHWPPEDVAQDGLYFESPADEALVHSEEHGRVVILAKPSLPV